MAEVYTLSAKIMTSSGEKSVLNLEAPKGRSFRKYGPPFKLHKTLDADGNINGYSTDFNMAAVAGFLADMTGLDISDIDELPAHDFQVLAGKLVAAITDPTAASN